jgi:Ni/Co efflux regulator RcnB
VKRLLIAVALTAALAVPAAAAADTSHATEVVVPRGRLGLQGGAHEVRA